MANWNEKAAQWAVDNRERATELAHEAWKAAELDCFDWLKDLEIGWYEALDLGNPTIIPDQLEDYDLEEYDLDRLGHYTVGNWESAESLRNLKELYDAVNGIWWDLHGDARFMAEQFENETADALGNATSEFWNDLADALDEEARGAVAAEFEQEEARQKELQNKTAFIDAAIAIAVARGTDPDIAAKAAEELYNKIDEACSLASPTEPEKHIFEPKLEQK